jgi:ubiquinol-cytochrome c reductase cytochrome c1 subunit
MKNLVLALLTVVSVSLPVSLAHAAGAGVPLDHVKVDIHDKAAMQSGLQTYTNYCMGCHGLQYSRYERVADDLGIPHELYEENLIFGDAKIGQLMSIPMTPKSAAAWFGAAPPDLSLVARLRGSDWLYSYLRGFYKDETRPWGVNNVVFKDVGMPHVLAELQGLCATAPVMGTSAEIDPISGSVMGAPGCKFFASKGSMSQEGFDTSMKNLVTFLTYVGEPSRIQAESIAPYVLLFLLILFVPAYLLNREYWKDVH